MKRVYFEIKAAGVQLYQDHIGNYMRRWILQTPFGALRVHKILRSDRTGAWHDHPADMTTLVVWGCYREWTPVAYGSEFYSICTLRNSERHLPEAGYGPRDFPPDAPHRPLAENYRDVDPLQINRIPASKLHRLELRFGPVWTIGWMRPRSADATWGFVDQHTGRWTEHEAWLAVNPDRNGESP